MKARIAMAKALEHDELGTSQALRREAMKRP